MSEEFEVEKLDAPLVVHKKSDASYKELESPEISMNETRVEDTSPTLKRHRFRKTESEKANKSFVFFLAIIVIAVGISILYATGGLDVKKDVETTTEQTTTQAVTSIEDSYEGTIVIKNRFIFVNGYEVKGIAGLQKALKYEDVSTTAYLIIDENADSDFLNNEILPILMDMGFYGEDTEITHKESTGLVAYDETTTTTTTTTTKKAKSTTQVDEEE